MKARVRSLNTLCKLINKCSCPDLVHILSLNKLMSVFLRVCPVIDHEFRHNIVKVAVDVLN